MAVRSACSDWPHRRPPARPRAEASPTTPSNLQPPLPNSVRCYAVLDLQGLFCNADRAFDVTSLRRACARRHIEAIISRNRRTAGWQTARVGLETCLHTWFAFHWLAFTVLLLRRIDKTQTS